MCKNGHSLRGSGKAFNLQRKNKDATVCRQTHCYEGMLIGNGYAIKGNIKEVKGEKKVLKLDGDEIKGDGEVWRRESAT